MFALAVKMLLHSKTRALATVAGVAVAFFLSAAQFGLMVGWCNTASAIIRHANVDLWIMARQTTAFDYGMSIPRQRIYQARSVAGVDWAEGMYMGWILWQRADGRRTYVGLVGIDDSLVGGPWMMSERNVDVVLEPDSVIIDDLYMQLLGVEAIGDEIELGGRRAVVKGISHDVRTLTAIPFVFTSLDAAVKTDQRYREDEVTYVLVRCSAGAIPEEVQRDLLREIPHVDVLTSREFAIKTMKYWMLETGLGITVVVTAVLGVLVGTVIISQTLYAITNDHLGNYATMLAIGFSPWRLAGVVLIQAIALGTLGIVGGTAGFVAAMRATAKTAIPLQITPEIFTALVAVMLLACIGASFVSMRSIFRVDPLTVFKA